MGKAFKIEVNRVNEDNVRIHKQCEQIDSLIGEEQIALIVLGEYQTEEAGIRCRANNSLAHRQDTRRNRTRNGTSRQHETERTTV